MISNWQNCPHKFLPYFGPVLHCRFCGARTMYSMDRNESKKIYPPINLEDIEEKDDAVK